MTVEEVMFARLTATGSATKAHVATRVYPAYVPDTATLPCIMYERKPDSQQTRNNIDGTIDHIRAVYKLNCYAAQEAFATAQATAEAVAQDLHNYRAALDGVTIHNIWHNQTYTDYDGVNKRQRVTVEVEIWYS
ncbi:MAG: DUF3168 domain-containing protein [Burkholderiaceae bacterium]